MNYFAHAHVAASFDADPAFVLGAMLPDFASMIRARIRGLDHARLSAGEAHHHRTDVAFHGSSSFRELVMEGTRWLDAHGVSRGPARGAAHVGIELLFDGALIGEVASDQAYLDALANAPALDAVIAWSGDAAPSRWRRLHFRLEHAGLPHALRDPMRVTERLVRALEPRPRLRLAPHERIVVERWLGLVQNDVVDARQSLLAETRDRIGTRDARSVATRPAMDPS